MTEWISYQLPTFEFVVKNKVLGGIVTLHLDELVNVQPVGIVFHFRTRDQNENVAHHLEIGK